MAGDLFEVLCPCSNRWVLWAPVLYFLCSLLYLNFANQAPNFSYFGFFFPGSVKVSSQNLSQQCFRSSRFLPLWGYILTLLALKIHLTFSKKMRAFWCFPRVRVHSRIYGQSSALWKQRSIPLNLKSTVGSGLVSPSVQSLTEVTTNREWCDLWVPPRGMTGRVRDLWYLSLLISFGQYVLKWFWPNLAGGPRSGLSSICVTLPGSLFVSPLCKVGVHVGVPCVRNCSSDRNSRSLRGSAFCSQFLCEFLVGRV